MRAGTYTHKMSELVFNTVLREALCIFKGEAFSSMYFGRHLEKNILILQHELTLMTVFGEDFHLSAPEFIKTVSFRGDRKKGVQIVGYESVILLLDEDGNLWRLINAFEVSSKKNECFHSLKGDCFYEWVPLKKFNFLKVLALSAMQTGFACLGLCGDFSRKLVVMSSFDSAVEDYTFDELNVTNNAFSFYLTNLNMNIKNSVYKNALDSTSEETLLITDRCNGKTYLCAKNGSNALVNVSDNYLISAFHLEEEKSFVLCFNNGKLVFCFYNECQKQSVAYLSDKLIFVEKCSSDPCLLWSDGINLNYTKLTFQCDENVVKLSHLKLNCAVQNPVSLLKVNHHFLTVTMNNVYYYANAGVRDAQEMTQCPKQLLSEIYKGSSLIQTLQEKSDLLAYYLHCKDITQRNKSKGKMEIKWEGNSLVIKNFLEITLREQFWKIQLMTTELHKKCVHIVDLETDLNKGGVIVIENPFKSKCNVKVSLVGEFDGRDLLLHLGEVNESESNFEKDHLRKQFQDILKKRNPCHMKGCKKEKE